MLAAIRTPLACLAAAWLVAGCAHAPAAASPAERQEKVVITGSRLPQRVDTRSGLPATISPVAIYTQEDLDRVGPSGDLATALRKLAPTTGR